MDARARPLLEKLLYDYEKAGAGVRKRPPAITHRHLAEYQQERFLPAKEAFEATMNDAKARGAVVLTWDGKPSEGFIDRVEIADADLLAKFLNIVPLSQRLSAVADVFEPLLTDFPVLRAVMSQWEKLRTVRSLGPDSVKDWLDAIAVIRHCATTTITNSSSIPLREASYSIFVSDDGIKSPSKRVESLTVPLDVLLCDSFESEPREPAAVWQELGLFKEEQPARLAGNIFVVRKRVSSVLDTPYAAFPPSTVERLGMIPQSIMSIENQTTFHSEARRRCDENVLLLYTAGMPSPAWRAMYARLLTDLPSDVPVFHWGDVDEGGFRIAARLANDAAAVGVSLKPWKMSPDDVPENRRRRATPGTCRRMLSFAEAAGWPELGRRVADAKFTVEQEGLA